MYPEVLQNILAHESAYFTAITKLDVEATELYERSSPADAVKAVTDFSSQIGNQLVSDWGSFFGQLFVKYRDGYVFTPNENSNNCGCSVGNGPYPQAWYDRIVEDTGDHYKVPSEAYATKPLLSSKGKVEHHAISKLQLLKRK
jgi:hypothetical protein